MEIKEQLVSFDLAREMEELCVKQDSLWWWENYSKNAYGYVKELEVTDHSCVEDEVPTLGLRVPKDYVICSAYTVAELGEMLPARIKTDYGSWTYLHITKRENTKEWVLDYNYLLDIAEIRENTEADARAKMLIYLIKEGYVKVEDLK